MEPLTIEDVATTSDETIVRRRFDTRNLGWLTILLLGFLVVTLSELNSNLGRRTTTDVAIAAPNTILILLLLFLMFDLSRLRRKGNVVDSLGVARYLSRHVGAMTISYLFVQYSLFIAFTRHSDDFAIWALTFPFLLLGFVSRRRRSCSSICTPLPCRLLWL